MPWQLGIQDIDTTVGFAAFPFIPLLREYGEWRWDVYG